MLGSMGLESRKPTLLPSDSPPQTGARSVLDSLLQGSRSEKKTSQSEKPADFMSSSSKTPGQLILNSSLGLLVTLLINSLICSGIRWLHI